MHMKLFFTTSVAVLVSLIVAMGSLAQAPPTRPPAPLKPAAPTSPALSPAEQREIGRELEGKAATLKQAFDQRLKKLDADMKAKVEVLNQEILQKANAEEAKAKEKIATWRRGFQGKKLEEMNARELEASRIALESELKRMQSDLSTEHSRKMKELEGDFTRQAGALEKELQAEVDRLDADIKRKYPKLQQVPTQ